MLFGKKKSASEVITEGRFEIKRLVAKEDIHASLQLAEDVFMQFEAPDFPPRGVESFRNFIWGRRVKEMLEDGSFVVWGCYCENQLVGMLAMRDSNHISLLFVLSDFHRQGIGRMLFAQAKKYAMLHLKRKITVNASPYGLPFYRAIGFREVSMESVVDGVRSTPMEAKI